MKAHLKVIVARKYAVVGGLHAEGTGSGHQSRVDKNAFVCAEMLNAVELERNSRHQHPADAE
jgi:hypothetical protein